MWLIGFASMVMNDQHQSDDQKNRQTAVNSLIKKLPEKFVREYYLFFSSHSHTIFHDPLPSFKHKTRMQNVILAQNMDHTSAIFFISLT
jgi:hypothetical protein